MCTKILLSLIMTGIFIVGMLYVIVIVKSRTSFAKNMDILLSGKQSIFWQRWKRDYILFMKIFRKNLNNISFTCIIAGFSIKTLVVGNRNGETM